MSEETTFKVGGLTVELGYDEDVDYANPRDCDNLGTIVGWHPDYILGDEQIAGDSDRGTRGAVRRDHHGSLDTLFMTENGRTDFRSMEVIERYLRLARGAVVVLPLYLLDHSGLSMSAGSNTVGRGDTAVPGGGSDSWGNPRGWDTTMCGFIYTTRERIEELCGKPQLSTDPFYCPRTWPEDGRSGENWIGTAEAWIAKQLDTEVEYYSAYLQGSVMYYAITNEDGDVLESVGGFLIASREDAEELEKEARSMAESYWRDELVEDEPDIESAAYEGTRA